MGSGPWVAGDGGRMGIGSEVAGDGGRMAGVNGRLRWAAGL